MICSVKIVNHKIHCTWLQDQGKLDLVMNCFDHKIHAMVTNEEGKSFFVPEVGQIFSGISGIPNEVRLTSYISKAALFFQQVYPKKIFLPEEQSYIITFNARLPGGMQKASEDEDTIAKLKEKRAQELEKQKEELKKRKETHDREVAQQQNEIQRQIAQGHQEAAEMHSANKAVEKQFKQGNDQLEAILEKKKKDRLERERLEQEKKREAERKEKEEEDRRIREAERIQREQREEGKRGLESQKASEIEKEKAEKKRKEEALEQEYQKAIKEHEAQINEILKMHGLKQEPPVKDSVKGVVVPGKVYAV